MGKILKFLVAVVILYFTMDFSYRMVVASNLRDVFSPKLGTDVEVRDVVFKDHYLESEVRTGTAVVSSKAVNETMSTDRGLLLDQSTVVFQSTGRYWPMKVTANPPRK